MKSMLLSLLIVAVLLALYLGPWTRGADDGQPPSDSFIRRCTTVFGDRSRPDDYCRCLWSHGVRNPGDTLIKPSAQTAAEACKAPTAPVDQGTPR